MSIKALMLTIVFVVSLTVAIFCNVSPIKSTNADRSARAIYSQMVETIREAKSLYIESDYRTAYQGKDVPRSTYRLWLKKPSYARMEGMLEDGSIRGVLVGDGNTFWVYYPNGRPCYGFEDSTAWAKTRMTSYMRYAIPAEYFSIAHKASNLGINISMTIIQPSIFHGNTDAIAGLIDSVTLIGTERINDEPCTIIEISYMDGQRMRTLWISDRDNLPRKLRQTLILSSNLVNHEDWTVVEIDCDMPDSLFSWGPPDDWTEFRFPNIEEGLLEPGTEAPDFSFRLLTGEDFRLSSQKGKTVLVNFWRVGCPPCREEIPYLESLYNKYKSRGLVILGYNCVDEKTTALEFLEKYGATYPNIVDSTSAAQEVYFHKYQTLKGYCAVPLNYVIDAEGKVAQAWYGYDSRADSTFEKALQKVGF